MKRVLVLLLCLLLLCGCGRHSDQSPLSTRPSLGPGQSGAAQPVQPPQLDTVAVEGAPGFYILSDLPQLSSYAISAARLTEDNVLWFLAGSRGEELHRLELDTGVEALVTTVPVQTDVKWASTDLLSVSPLAVSQSAFGTETVYAVGPQGALTPLSTLNDQEIPTWNVWFTETDCIWMDGTTDTVVASPLDGGAARAVCQIPADYFYCVLLGLTADGAQAIVGANCGREDSVLLTLSLDTGEITGIFVNDEDGAALALLQGAVHCRAAADEDMVCYTLTAREGERQVTAQFPLSLLACEGATVVGQDWWMDCSGTQPFWGRTLVTADHYHQGNWLLLWDYREAETETVSPGQPVPYVPREPVDRAELEAKAAALEDTYGISIHIGEDMDAPYPDYTLSPCTDTDAAADALDTLEAAFSLYPEDYFRQLGGDSIRGFSFYLCGVMTPLDPSSNIDSPGGLSCQVDGVELLAFDITGEVRVQDVVHELAHVLDHWLWEGDVLSEDQWSRLNPKDFSYYYAYVDPTGMSYEWAGDSRYTAWGDAYYDGDVESVWFVDPYSTTYPTEDRARLMEFLLSQPDSPPDYFKSSHIQAKLDYYFQCIRQKFDTSAWPEQTSWEAALAGVHQEG